MRPALTPAALTLAVIALSGAPAVAQDRPVRDAPDSAAIAQTVEAMTAALLAMPVGPLADAMRRVDPSSPLADIPADATVGDMVHADPHTPQRMGREAQATGEVATGVARDFAAAMPVLKAMAHDLAAQWQARWDERNR